MRKGITLNAIIMQFALLTLHYTIPRYLGIDDLLAAIDNFLMIDQQVENSIALCPNCHRELHFGYT